MAPGTFHLRLIIDIQLCSSYKKASRRLGERTSESRARGVITSVGGTFNIFPHTILKPTVSTFRISKQSSIGLYRHLASDIAYMNVEPVVVVHVAASDALQTALSVEKWAELQK